MFAAFLYNRYMSLNSFSERKKLLKKNLLLKSQSTYNQCAYGIDNTDIQKL